MEISGYSKNPSYSILQHSLRILQENYITINIEAITKVARPHKNSFLFILKQNR